MNGNILCSDIYKVLATPSYNYSITMYDTDGEGTINPSQAKWFYVSPVNFMIQTPDLNIPNRPEVYLWKSTEIRDTETLDVLERIKQVVNQYGFGFTINDFGSGNLPKKFSHLALRNMEETKLQESVEFTGSAKRSYLKYPNSRLIIVHTDKVDESIKGSRTKNIKDIFVEHNGERKRIHSNNVNLGKALAYHLNAGGSWGDRFSTGMNLYGDDLDSLTKLLPELQINGNMVQASKVLQMIKDINKYIRSASTRKGYERILNELSTQPRVGIKYVDDYTTRINPSKFSPELMKSYTRQHLIGECKKINEYIDTIRDNVYNDYQDSEISRLAKHICLGSLPVKSEFQIPDNDPKEDQILLYGNILQRVIDNPIIEEILGNICSKPHIMPNDALLIVALINSAYGKKPLGTVPEMDELVNWVQNSPISEDK